MRVGRYSKDGQSRVFLGRGNGELVDSAVLEEAGVPEAVRSAANRLRSGIEHEFYQALPVVEDHLLKTPGALESAPPLSNSISFEAPARPRNFICIGLNYRDHAAEAKMELPKQPLLFAKTANALNSHNAEVKIPARSSQVDFEAEMAVVISKRCQNVTSADALQFVAGYTCGNDVSSRDFQFADGQWYRGKSCDGYGPLGPWLVTPLEVGDAANLGIRLRLNGEVMQDSSTSNLVFSVPELIEHISSEITLEAGDVILTGTPPGVGFSRKPPVYLKRGDLVEVEIERIGTLRNRMS